VTRPVTSGSGRPPSGGETWSACPRPALGAIPRSSTTPARSISTARTPGCTSPSPTARSEEHTSELQSRVDIVCRLLLEKKKIRRIQNAKVRQTGIVGCESSAVVIDAMSPRVVGTHREDDTTHVTNIDLDLLPVVNISEE